MAKAEDKDERRARFLNMVDQGGQDFEGAKRAPIKTLGSSALSPEIPLSSDLKPPTEPEGYRFTEPAPSRRNLTQLGFEPFGSKMPPDLKKAGTQLAEEMGMDFAMLLAIALGLVVDPAVRSTETQELLDRLKNRWAH